MTKINKKVQIGHRAPLVKKLLLVEGISRSGKFLMANILNAFKDVEPVQYSGFVEHLPFMEELGLVEYKTAKELLRQEIDMRCYEMLLGRNLNHRLSDKSSVFKIPGYEAYLKRSEEKDTDKELKNFYARGAYSFFVIHELMPRLKIFFDAFPEVKVISLARSPVELVNSWFNRGLSKRLGSDPKLFPIPIQGKHGPVPWYVYGHEKEYESLGEMDRTILGIEILFKMYQKTYRNFSVRDKKKIIFIRYEDIIMRPKNIISAIGKFIKKNPLKEMRAILKRENIPNASYLKGMEAKIASIKEKASPAYFKRLMDINRKYTSPNFYA